jgi:hypothetical protein
MSLRFSLLSLIGLVSWAALACAALVHPGAGWLSVVVSLTAAAIVWQALVAINGRSASRAAAAGWLLFAIGYLAVARGPWLGQVVGPQLISTQALNYAQVNWRKEDPNPAVVQPQQWMDPAAYNPLIFSNTLSFPVAIATPPQPPAINTFQLAGHWLIAWLAGWLGAAVAGHCYRGREKGSGVFGG